MTGQVQTGDLRIKGFWDLWIYGFMDLGIQGLRDLGILSDFKLF